MKNLLFVPVNYNSYDELEKHLLSLKKAIDKLPTNSCNVLIAIADNSTIHKCFDECKFGFTNIRTYKFNNIGYFGGAFRIINQITNLSEYDYVVISNVDIFYHDDFLLKLCENIYSEEIGWVSPFRYSLTYQQPLSSGIKINRASKFKMMALRFYFKFPSLVKYRWNIMKKRRAFPPNRDIYDLKEIYHGCGSCFILTKYFFKKNTQIDYPVFLYGEEIFIAELCRNSGLRVVYDPSLKIDEIGSVSTGNVNIRQICKFNLEGLRYNYRRFYFNK